MKRIFLSTAFSIFTLMISAQKKEVKKPNILWITCEDISPTLSFYGDPTAKTPNLDALAKESLIFDNSFATTGVSAPSRSAIITGMLPTSIGTMHMRTGNDVQAWGKENYENPAKDSQGNAVLDLTGKPIIEYSAVIPENIKCFTEYLRAAGYYCTNNAKTDYQFAAPQSAWDENSGKAHWRNAPKGMPFFSVFNINDTHESKIWEHRNLPMTVDPKTVKLPPYYPDNEVVRNDVARHYSNVEMMDKKVGEIIEQLKKDGLYDNTIIFFYSDHGGPLPRQKREIFDSGLRTPLLIHFPSGENKGRTSQMVSYVDLAPTVLSLAEIKPPQYMDGKAFLGKFKTSERKVIYGTSDRFDEFTDRIRAVRDQQFLYVKNYYKDLPKYKNVSYRFKIPMMLNILELKKENKLNEDQKYWFLPKTSEELYDTSKDPYQLHNLAANPAYKNKLEELRQYCINQFEMKIDYGSVNEDALIEQMWPGKLQPTTSAVNISLQKGLLYLSCATKGASISYIEIPENSTDKITKDSHWKLYTEPFIPQKGMKVLTKASRIGFKESVVAIFQ